MIERDFFSMMEPGIFKPVTQSLLEWGDYYMLSGRFQGLYPDAGARRRGLPRSRAGGTERRSST